MRREPGLGNIDVARPIIESGVDTALVGEMMEKCRTSLENQPEDGLMNPESVAEIYWNLHRQTRDA